MIPIHHRKKGGNRHAMDDDKNIMSFVMKPKKIILSSPSRRPPVLISRKSPRLPKLKRVTKPTISSLKKITPRGEMKNNNNSNSPRTKSLFSHKNRKSKSAVNKYDNLKQSKRPDKSSPSHNNNRTSSSPRVVVVEEEEKILLEKKITNNKIINSSLPSPSSTNITPLPSITNSSDDEEVKRNTPILDKCKIQPAAAMMISPSSLINNEPTELFTNVFIAGAGPAACGLLINVERSGKLRDILEGGGMEDVEDTDMHTIIMAEKSNQYGVGRGQLGKYLCPSNTSAGCFVKNVTRPDDYAKNPPSYLSELEELHSAKMLLKCGSLQADLTQVGQFLNKSAGKIAKRFDDVLSKGKLLINTCVEQIVVKKDHTYEITCLRNRYWSPPVKVIIYAKKILLAVGGVPYLPESIRMYVSELEKKYLKNKSKSPKKKSSNNKKSKIEKPPLLISGEEVLKKGGLYKVFQYLKSLCYHDSTNNGKDPLVAPQIVIIGGSHSALAAANLLLQTSRKDGRLVNILNCHRDSLSNNSNNLSSSSPSSNSKIKTVPKHKEGGGIVNETNYYEIFDELEKKKQQMEDGMKKVEEDMKQKSMPIYKFKAGDILCLHRSPMRLFFHSLENATNAGYKIDESALSRKNRRVHPHTGLRGPARNLVIKVKKGREHCVKFQLCNNEIEIQKRLDKAKPRIIIYSTGYSANANNIGFLKHDKKLTSSSSSTEESSTEINFCKTKSGSLLVSESGELLHTVDVKNRDGTITSKESPLKNCFSLGLGTVYGADHIAIGGESDANEKGADGVNLYIGALGKHVRNGIWPKYYEQEMKEEAEEKAKAKALELETKRKEEEEKKLQGEKKLQEEEEKRNTNEKKNNDMKTITTKVRT